MRWAMPQPCMGSSARVLRIRRSNVPWTKSVGLLIHPPQLSTVQYMLALLLSIAKGRFSDPNGGSNLRTHDGTPLIRLDTGNSLAAAVSQVLAATDNPQIARWIQFPTAAVPLHLVPNDPESGA